jgi:hypothetical protein
MEFLYNFARNLKAANLAINDDLLKQLETSICDLLERDGKNHIPKLPPYDIIEAV